MDINNLCDRHHSDSDEESIIINDEDFSVMASPDGKITGVLHLDVYGIKKDVPINTTLDEMDEYDRRKADPNSCARMPNDDETVIRIPDIKNQDDFVFGPYWRYVIGWGKCDMYHESMCEAMEQGYNNFLMPTIDYMEAMYYAEQKRNWEKAMYVTRDLNNNGIALEKEGRVDEAIAVYEENVKNGSEFFALHAFDRLIVLYRKRKEYGKECAVIEKVIRLSQRENRIRVKSAIKDHPDKKQEIILAYGKNERLKDEDGRYLFCPYEVIKYEKRLEKVKLLLQQQNT